MFQKLPLNPGVYVDDTPLKAEGFFIHAQWVRFVRGLPQTMGGYEYVSPTHLNGICRGLHAWADYGLVKWIAAGTHTNLYGLTDSVPYDCTPVATRTQGVSLSFTTTLGSAVVTADWASHGLIVGQSFILDSATVPTVGGVTINTPAATATTPSPWYVVIAVNTANQITFTAAQVATSGAGPTASTVNIRVLLAPGLADSIGALGYGVGVWSTGSTYSGIGTAALVSARTYSVTNYGQNLIASPRGGKIYEWAPITTNSELVTNGTFTGSAAGWALGANWGYSANTIVATASSASATQAVTTPANAFYLASADVSAWGTGTVDILYNGNVISGMSAIAANGTYKGTFFSTGGAQTLAIRGTNATATVDNVSIKQLTTAEVIPNAPTQNTVVIVTAEGFVMACGTVEASTGNFNPLHIRWSDIATSLNGEQIWTPSATNQSSFVTLLSGSRIVGAKLGNTEVLVWTDKSLYAGTFVNNTGIVYSWRLAGTNCGLIGPNAAAVLGGVVYWMDVSGQIWSYAGGSPSPVKSTMSKDLFDHLALAQQDKVYASGISQFKEVIWLYPDSRDGNECSRYSLLCASESVAPPTGTNPGTVVGCFAPGALARTAMIDSSIGLPYPIAVDPSGYVYFHEKGYTANGDALAWSLETGSFQIGTGATLFRVDSFIPDFAGLSGGGTLVASGYRYPQSIPTTTGPFMFTAASEKIDMMVSPPIGREVSFLFNGSSSPAFMRTGALMMDVSDTGMAF